MEIVPCPEGALKPKGQVKKCHVCKHDFGVTRWKYNCHVCGEVVCDDCSKSEAVLQPVYSKPMKVCDHCKPKLPTHAIHNPQHGAHTLGGSAPASAGTEEEEREKRARAADARMKQQQSRGMQPTSSVNKAASSNPPSTTRLTEAPTPNNSLASQPSLSAPTPNNSLASQPSLSAQLGVQQTSSNASSAAMGAPTTSEEVEDSRARADAEANPALAAALRRQQLQAATRGNAPDPAADSEKIFLLAQINGLLRQRGESEPFGLRGMDASKLRMYLRHLQEKR